MKNTLKIIFFPLYKLVYQPLLLAIVYNHDLLHLFKIIFCKSEGVVNAPGYVIFTTHKTASTGLTKMLSSREIKSKYGLCNLDQIFSLIPFSHNFWYTLISRFSPFGGTIYGPIRERRDFFLDGEMNIILFLRDPRDVLVSSFFSQTRSHSLTNIKNIYNRINKNRCIDE